MSVTNEQVQRTFAVFDSNVDQQVSPKSASAEHFVVVVVVDISGLMSVVPFLYF